MVVSIKIKSLIKKDDDVTRLLEKEPYQAKMPLDLSTADKY